MKKEERRKTKRVGGLKHKRRGWLGFFLFFLFFFGGGGGAERVERANKIRQRESEREKQTDR